MFNTIAILRQDVKDPLAAWEFGAFNRLNKAVSDIHHEIPGCLSLVLVRTLRRVVTYSLTENHPFRNPFELCEGSRWKLKTRVESLPLKGARERDVVGLILGHPFLSTVMGVNSVKDLMGDGERQLNIGVVRSYSAMLKVVEPVPSVSLMNGIVHVEAIVGVRDARLKDSKGLDPQLFKKTWRIFSHFTERYFSSALLSLR
jgi:hypothetical protein